jgi:SAM-dependent methyltransferase
MAGGWVDLLENDWVQDSRSFNRVAGLYDAYRPGYPKQLVDDILSIANFPEDGRILEIGSGTGKATLQFAQHGYAMLCIEPGESMVEVARRKLQTFPKVDFRITAFEGWENEGELFDLVISGQAFHWIQPEFRYQKTRQVMKETGSLAIFWNWNLPVADRLTERIEGVYEQYAPELAQEEPESHEEIIQKWVREIDESHCFNPVVVQRYRWEKEYPTREYLGLLNTHSDHLRLTDERRQRLFAALEDVLEAEGGNINKVFESVAFIAHKRND